MNMTATGVPAPAVKQATPSLSESTAKSTEVSFAQVMNSLAKVGDVANDSQSAQSTPQTSLTWRDMQDMVAAATRSVNSTGDLAEVPMDSVLQDLLEMLKQVLGENPTSLSAGQLDESLDIAGKLMKRLEELLQENGEAVAGQQLLALLTAMQPDQMALQSEQPKLGQDAQLAILGSVLQGQPQDLLQLLSGIPAQVIQQTAAGVPLTPLFADTLQAQAKQALPQSQNDAALLQQAENAQAQVVSVAKPETAAQTGQSGQFTELNLQEITQSAVQDATSVTDPELDFQNAIRQVKEQLGQGKTEQSAQPETDVDALQKQVDAGVHLRNITPGATSTELSQAEKLWQPAPLAEQVQTGILAALQKGEESINIKLSPEGLGELTIRLTKTPEGMSLNLVAKSSETAKLLSEELNHLRDTLKPLRVAVDQVLTEHQDALLNQQQSFDQQTRQDWRSFRGAAYYGDEPLGGVSPTEKSVPSVSQAAISLAKAALDTYI